MPGTPGTARPAAWSRIRRAWRARLRPTPFPGSGTPPRIRLPDGLDTGYRNGYAAGYRAALDLTKKQASATTPPAIVLLLRGHDRPQAEARPASARNSARSTFPRRTSFSQGPTWRANRSSARWPPPALFVPFPPRVAPRLHLRRRIPGDRGLLLQLRQPRGAGQPGCRLPLPGRAHRTHQPAGIVQLRGGISACRSDGNPTTRTTTAPTS